MDDDNQGVAWDLSDYFPEFNGPQMRAFKADLQADIAALLKKGRQMAPLDAESYEPWEAFVVAVEDASQRLGHLASYLECLTAAYADREDYAIADAAVEGLRADYKKIEIQMVSAFKDVKMPVWRAFVDRPQLTQIRYYLMRLHERSRFSMGAPKEMLASDLNIDGLQAWGRLYNKITGKLTFTCTRPGGVAEQLPMSQWRSLMSHPDRRVGRAAYEGGNLAWQSIEDVCGAALNAIAGSRLSLDRHRGRTDFLDEALFQAGIERQTLEAMYAAIHRHIDFARDILREKARFFGRSGIWFFEREAPLPIEGTGRYGWQQVIDLVASAFNTAYPALAGYFRSMLDRRWIDSEPRPAKRPGAFCTHSVFNRQQRIFMTFNQTLGNATTLAHEVGHAWHSHLMRRMRPWAGRYPMTLAETASTFAEYILAEGIYRDDRIAEREKFLMLDEQLSGAAVLLLDITTRYEFEKSFYQMRRRGEVPVSELKQLMSDTQQRIFGDALLSDGADPYFWASKLHFYITDTTFYNFPYTFGFLLARALAGLLKDSGPEVLKRYEKFLTLTGSGGVEDVIQQSLAIDIRNPDFWESALSSLAEPLRRYRTLMDRYQPDRS